MKSVKVVAGVDRDLFSAGASGEFVELGQHEAQLILKQKANEWIYKISGGMSFAPGNMTYLVTDSDHTTKLHYVKIYSQTGGIFNSRCWRPTVRLTFLCLQWELCGVFKYSLKGMFLSMSGEF